MAGNEFIPGEQYVDQDPDSGLYNVIYGGGGKGSFGSQSDAESYYNSLFPSSAATGPLDSKATGGPVSDYTLYPGLSVDAINMEREYKRGLISNQQAELEYRKAYMDKIQHPSMESEIRFRDAQTRMQEARDEYDKIKYNAERADRNQRFDVDTRKDIWKEQGNRANDMANQTGFYKPPSENPELPYHYLQDQMNRDYRARFGTDPSTQQRDEMLPWYSAGVPGSTGPSGQSPADIQKAKQMWDWGRVTREQSDKPLTREDWVNRWGESGGQLYDTAKEKGINPRENSVNEFLQVAPQFGGSTAVPPRRSIAEPNMTGVRTMDINQSNPNERTTPMPEGGMQPPPPQDWRSAIQNSPEYKKVTEVSNQISSRLQQARDQGVTDNNQLSAMAEQLKKEYGYDAIAKAANDKARGLTPQIMEEGRRYQQSQSPQVRNMQINRERITPQQRWEQYDKAIARQKATGEEMYISPPSVPRPTESSGDRYQQSVNSGEGAGYKLTGPLRGSDGSYITQGMMKDWGDLTGYTPGGQKTATQRNYETGVSGYLDGQKTMNREKLESDIWEAKEKLRLAESQGNEDLARQERERIDAMTRHKDELTQRESEFGRDFGLRETETMAGLTGYVPGTEGTGGGKGQLTAAQRNFYIQQYGYDPGESGTAGATQYGGQTIEGRGQTLAETTADRDWQFRQAQMASNPANYAMMQAFKGQAPWQAGQGTTQTTTPGTQSAAPRTMGVMESSPTTSGTQPTTTPTGTTGGGNTQDWQSAFSSQSSQFDPKNTSWQMYDKLRPDQKKAYGSMVTATRGQSTEDYDEEMRQYRPQKASVSAARF